MPLPFFNSEEKIELDLNNPIFAIYVDTTGLSAERSEMRLREAKRTFDIYKNVTFWVVSSNVTKVECVYDGQCRTRDLELSELLQEMNTRVDILSKSSNFEDFKINIRNWRINTVVENGTEKE